MKTKVLAILAAGLCAFAACSHAVEPAPPGLRAALEKYLQESGNLCLGKFDWPIEVSERDRQTGARDAVQMPILEKMGIVSSSVVEKRDEGADHAVTVTRYELTGAGRKYYLARETTNVGADGKTIVHHGDFCAAKLSLDKIIGWNRPQAPGNDQQAMVAYTYTIAAADWARKPEVQQVFPMVERIIKGERTLQLEQLFRLTKNGWVAVAP
ncbi:MAG TPA: hypothetical protein VF934_03035 [Burkholderiales bacterium]